MNFTFVGCSITAGVGLENKQDGYANLVSTEYDAWHKNIAKEGSSNYDIFMSALEELSTDVDIVFVQWSGLNRAWMYPGPDTRLFINSATKSDYSYRDLYITNAEINKFSRMYLLLNHDYKLLMELARYCEILNKLADDRNIRIVHINGLLSWTEDLFNDNTHADFSSMSDYAKQLLDFDTRDDDEMVKLFLELNSKLVLADTTRWPNMFKSLSSMTVDLGTDGIHAGMESNKQFANMIINYLGSINE